MDEHSAISHYAVLIGIDDYPEHPLRSAVHDIEQAQELLENDLGEFVSISTLVAKRNDHGVTVSIQDPKCRPTYENVCSVLRTVTATASPGNFVYFHFSGHAARNMKQDISSENDVALVLSSEDDSKQVSYLYGGELVKQIKRMVEKQLIVTVVLDCDFSGALYQQESDIYHLSYDPGIDSQMQHMQESLSQAQNNTLNLGSYAILTACGPNKFAGSALFDGKSHGVLSYFLLETLKYAGLSRSHKTVHDYICAKIRRTGFLKQNPILYGNRDQAFFGPSKSVTTTIGISIVEKSDGIFELEAGHAHGVSSGDEFALSPMTTVTTDAASHHIPLTARVISCSGLTSILEIISKTITSARTGWLATHISQKQRRSIPIRLTPSVPEHQLWYSAMNAKSLEIHSGQHDYLAVFQLLLSDDNHYQILDKSGSKLANLPSMPRNAISIEHVCDILEHLVRYQLAKDLINISKDTDFLYDVNISIRIHGTSYSWQDQIAVVHDTTAEVVVENKGTAPVYVFALDFGPYWQVEPIFHGAYIVGPQSVMKRKIRMSIPESEQKQGHRTREDMLKIIVTSQPTSFDMLELPPLLGRYMKRSRSGNLARGADSRLEGWTATNFPIYVYLAPEDYLKQADQIKSLENKHDSQNWTTETLNQLEPSLPQPQEVELTLKSDGNTTTDVPSEAAHPPENLVAARDVSSSIPPPTFIDSGYGSGETGRHIDADKFTSDDSVSSYSDNTLPLGQKSAYQLTFVEIILTILNHQLTDETSLENLVEVLPDMLRTFALKIGYRSESQPAKDVMKFTIKYRREITTLLEERWHDEQQQEKRKAEKVPWKERMIRLEPYTDFESTIHEDIPGHIVLIQNDIQNDIPVGGSAFDQEEVEVIETIDMDIVLKSSAYVWLVAELEKTTRLTVPNLEIDSLFPLTQSLSDVFPLPQNISRRLVQQEHRIIFSVEWNPVEFLDQYSFDDMVDAEQILKNFITLTSDGRHVQALTCEQFLQQMWPTSGKYMLSLLIQLVQDGHAELELEGAKILGWLQDQRVCIEVTGHSQSIKEAGEQLAWIGSAMWLSPDEGHIYYCSPSYSNICSQSEDTDKLYDRTKEPYHCTISFNSGSMEAGSIPNGCWYKLFQYPVIANGFPITKRPESISGLEIELGTMLALSHAQHVGKFYHKIAIKGFSSMFTLTSRAVGSSLWHYSGDIDGPFISYVEIPDSPDFASLDVHKVIQDRHFVGWCKSSTYGVGAVSSDYDIGESGLLKSGPGYRLSSRHHRRPHRPGRTCACTARNKRRKTRTYQQSFVERLNYIETKLIILWDTGNQRGWFTNGTSALLHLAFASLEHDANGSFKTAYSFRRSDIRSPNPHEPGSAAKILADEHNMNLKIKSYDQTVYFRDRVEDMCYFLEAMIEDEISLSSLEQPSMDVLEGWDFTDIAHTDCDPLLPRAIELPKDRSGWPDFVKETYALVLFGRRFGELYRPIDEHPCSHWAHIPADHFYFAASVRDLEWIMGRFGSRHDRPRRLSQSITWTVLPTTFEGCSCDVTQEHSNLVQILASSSNYKPPATAWDTVDEVPEMGAVVFGEITHSQRSKNGYSSLIRSHNPVNINSAGNRSYDKGNGYGSSTASLNTSLRRGDYSIAIICAIPIELRAVCLLFDEEHKNKQPNPDDSNQYVLGKIHEHNIVAACLPKGRYGTCSATAVATHLKRSFPNIDLYILVGIAGGIPTYDNDIRLGDVVVSVPGKGHPGILEYDFETLMQDAPSYTLGSLPQPPTALLSAISHLQSGPDLVEDSLQPYLEYISSRDRKYTHPYPHPHVEDRLYASDYQHIVGEGSCISCFGPTISRKNRETVHPRIHYGLVASGDKLVKDARIRDAVQKRHQPLCFEMEAAGIANTTPCLVIRGICDYSDSHKNDTWQEYACATAASYTKLLLSNVIGIRKPS